MDFLSPSDNSNNSMDGYCGSRETHTNAVLFDSVTQWVAGLVLFEGSRALLQSALLVQKYLWSQSMVFQYKSSHRGFTVDLEKIAECLH